ncbi:MAG: patatin-like phospholipase family protein [Candidatus Eisenbacteria sp.]|nr:patatin-like phospholipase family protein [Candidatus Eisenbacteria bacterium]
MCRAWGREGRDAWIKKLMKSAAGNHQGGGKASGTAGVAVALSGGAARTIAHIGVLKVLAREGIPVSRIAGTSGGALIAVLVAAGYPLVDLEVDACRAGWYRLAEVRPHPLGILSTEKLREFVERRIGELCIEDFPLPCAVVATDLTSGCRRVFDSGPAGPAVAASCAIPEFYRPVKWEGHDYVDGGLVEPLPVRAARALAGPEGETLIAVSVLRPRAIGEGPRHIWQLVGRITEVVQNEMVRRDREAADVYIEPAVADFSYLDLRQAEELIAAGAAAMEQQLDRLWRQIGRTGSASRPNNLSGA